MVLYPLSPETPSVLHHCGAKKPAAVAVTDYVQYLRHKYLASCMADKGKGIVVETFF
jgi:hypothetical protein